MKTITKTEYQKITAISEKWGIASIKVFQLYPWMKNRWDFLIALKADVSSFMQNGFQKDLTDLLKENEEECVFTFTIEDLAENEKHHIISESDTQRILKEAQDLNEFVSMNEATTKITSFELKTNKESDTQKNFSAEIPKEYRCSFSKMLMEDPVMAADGMIYERKIIVEWLQMGYTFSPITNEPLTDFTLVDNTGLKEKIQQFKQTSKTYVSLKEPEALMIYQFELPKKVNEINEAIGEKDKINPPNKSCSLATS